MSTAANPTGEGKEFLGHPRGLFILFFSELWERFSYYGMRALLTLYMVKVLLMSDEASAGVYGAYTGLVYLFPVLGGYLADKVLGYRKSIILGGLLMAIGHGLMAVEQEVAFYSALAFLCIGNGFFKPNISSTVGKLYEPGDQRRDAGFTIFYMGINIGAMLAPLICGWLGEDVGWHWGFGAAAIGMLLGLVIFVLGTKELRGKGEPSNPEVGRRQVVPGLSLERAIYLAAFVGTPLVAGLLYYNDVVPWLVAILGSFVLLMLLRLGFSEGAVGRDRIFSLLILMAFHALFWAFFEQAGSSLTLFTDRVVDRAVPLFGTLTASQFQAVNPIFIILFAPVFTIVWTRLGTRQPSIPIKFALGLLQLGLGFGVLVLGMNSVGEGEKVIWMFVVLMYLLHTTGELCLSPVGLSAVTKLAPPAATGFVMGGWFLSISLGNIIAGQIAGMTEVSFEKDENPALHAMTSRTFAFGKGMPGSLTIAGLDEKQNARDPLGFARLELYAKNIDGGTLLDEGQKTAVLGSLATVEEGVTFLEVVEVLGELGIAPERVIAAAERDGVISPAAAVELRTIIGPEGMGLGARTLEGNQLEDVTKSRKKWIREFAKAKDLGPDLRDAKMEGVAPKQVWGAHEAVDAMSDHLIQPVMEKYRPVYFWVFVAAVGLSVLLFLISPFVKKLMHGVM